MSVAVVGDAVGGEGSSGCYGEKRLPQFVRTQSHRRTVPAGNSAAAQKPMLCTSLRWLQCTLYDSDSVRPGKRSQER